MPSNPLPDLPESLRARLAAHGAVDEQGVRAALEADPALKQEFEAFLAQNQGQIDALVAEAFDAFAATRDSDELRELARGMPFLLDDAFAELVEDAIEDAEQHGDGDSAEGLRARLDGLRQIRDQHDLENGPPLVQALVAFLNAPDGTQAAAVFHERRDLLAGDEAQATLDAFFQGADPESQQRVEERSALLARLRHTSGRGA
jgi:hypothetical protein